MILPFKTRERHAEPAPTVDHLADEYGLDIHDVTPCHLKLIDENGTEWELLR